MNPLLTYIINHVSCVGNCSDTDELEFVYQVLRSYMLLHGRNYQTLILGPMHCGISLHVQELLLDQQPVHCRFSASTQDAVCEARMQRFHLDWHRLLA